MKKIQSLFCKQFISSSMSLGSNTEFTPMTKIFLWGWRARRRWRWRRCDIIGDREICTETDADTDLELGFLCYHYGWRHRWTSRRVELRRDLDPGLWFCRGTETETEAEAETRRNTDCTDARTEALGLHRCSHRSTYMEIQKGLNDLGEPQNHACIQSNGHSLAPPESRVTRQRQ